MAAGTGIFVLFKRHGLIRDFRRALDEGKERFSREVGARLREKLGLIYEEIRRSCAPFTDEVQTARTRLAPLEERRAARLEKARTEW